MRDGKEKVTIRNVAQRAGVSIATVSRYLNHSGYVEEETGRRIAEAVEMTHYAPSMAARTLKTKRSSIVLLVVPDICNPFYSSMALHVQALVGKRGYAMALYNTNGKPAEEEASVRLARQIDADGVLFCSIDSTPHVISALMSLRAETVWLNAYVDSPFDSVTVAQIGGTYLAARHLIELGHRHIAFAGGLSDSMIGRSRCEGYERALEEAGLERKNEWMFEMGFLQEDGYKAGLYFSTLQDQITAICCANDLIALGVMDALQEKGLRIPQDISVTGMDDIPYARTASPRLTTITNDSEAFAKEGVRMLFERIKGEAPEAPRRLEIEHELVVRASTGQPNR